MTAGWSLIVMLLSWWPAALNPAGALDSPDQPAGPISLTEQVQELQRQAQLLGESV